MRPRAVLAILVVAGCPGSDPPPACVTVDPACTPLLYAPTFDNVYTMTLATSCGSQRTSCHSAAGRAGNLSMADEPTAYSELMKAGRVLPDNPGCSKMIVRISSVGDDYQMPQGPASSALTDGQQCTLVHWIAAGAPGPGSGSAP